MTNALGLPLAHTGNFAAVFQVQGPPDWALKCFTRKVPGLERQYQAIHKHLDCRRLPFMVRFDYQAEGVLVRGQRYPLVKMDWVQGMRLDEFPGRLPVQAGFQGRIAASEPDVAAVEHDASRGRCGARRLAARQRVA